MRRLAWHWYLLAFLACCGICFVARVCVTVIGLGQSSFLCPQVSGLLLQFMHLPLHVLVLLPCVVVHFLEFFRVFYFILRHFSSEPFAQVLWCFPRAFLVFFFGRLGYLLMSPFVVARFMCAGLFIHGFKLLSMPTTPLMFNSLSVDRFVASPSSGDSVAISTVASGASNSLSNEIAVAVAQAL